MFDIGFSELLLIAVIGLVVLGPERFTSGSENCRWVDPCDALYGCKCTKRVIARVKAAGAARNAEKVEEKANLEALSP